jgi:hypothetical protein
MLTTPSATKSRERLCNGSRWAGVGEPTWTAFSLRLCSYWHARGGCRRTGRLWGGSGASCDARGGPLGPGQGSRCYRGSAHRKGKGAQIRSPASRSGTSGANIPAPAFLEDSRFARVGLVCATVLAVAIEADRRPRGAAPAARIYRRRPSSKTTVSLGSACRARLS